MEKRTQALILIVAGALLALISLLADVIGLGRAPGFGYGQIAGLLIGLAALVAGIVILRQGAE